MDGLDGNRKGKGTYIRNGGDPGMMDGSGKKSILLQTRITLFYP